MFHKKNVEVNSKMTNNEKKLFEKNVATKYKRNNKIGLFAFLALTSSMVLTVYEYPIWAVAGYAAIIFLLIAGLCFFIPVALAAAEMGTIKTWEKGGVFIWISNTLGRKWGFYAISLQWFANTIGFLGMLYFITSALGFTFGGVTGFNLLTIGGQRGTPGSTPFQLTTNGLQGEKLNQVLQINSGIGFGMETSALVVSGIVFAVVALIFIIVTLSQMFGIKYTSLISRIGFIIGICIPTLILIIIGSIFIAKNGLLASNNGIGTFSDTGATAHSFTRGLPGIAAFGAFAAVVLSFIGVEGSGSLANRLNRVGRNYPISIFSLFILAISFSVVGGLIIALTTSSATISQSGGIFITFANIFDIILPNSSPFVAIGIARFLTFLICFGVIAQISSWIVAPSTGMMYAAQNKIIPSVLAKTNRFKVPVAMIALQTVFTLVWNLIITVGLGFNGASSFNFAILATTLIFLSYYVIYFIGYLKLIFKAPKIQRSFKLKWNWLRLISAFVGLAMIATTIIEILLPPSGTPLASYYIILIVIWAIGLLVPSIAYFATRKYRIKHKLPIDVIKIPELKNNENEIIQEIE